jgi:hypothetical protein
MILSKYSLVFLPWVSARKAAARARIKAGVMSSNTAASLATLFTPKPTA